MKKIALLLPIILYCQFLTAQNKISGTISDEQNIPLAGANVFVPEINKGTVSDTSGRYELKNLPNGKLKIQFSFIGYANHIETVLLSGTALEINAQLRITPIQSEELVISGGYSSSQHENAVKIEILRLDPMGVKHTPNFTEMLTQVPGVDMISKGSGVSKPVIRGLSMNDILVLNNGVRIENYQYSDHHPLGIDEFGIEDVEIIKGPASLLYGSDAIGGVINFIKEKPAPVGTLVGDYILDLFSNTLGMTNDLGIKGSLRKFYGGLRIGQKTNADFLQGGGDFVPNSRFNEWSLKANIGTTGRKGMFTLYYDYGVQRLGLTEEEAIEEITSRGRNTEIWYQQFGNHMLSARNKLYLGKMKLDLNAAGQSTNLIHYGEADQVGIEMRLNTLIYETKLFLPSDAFSEYIVGFQGMNQQNTNRNDRKDRVLPDAVSANYGFFGLAQHSFFKKLKLQAGVRYDFKSISSEEYGSPEDPDYHASLERSYGSFSGSLGATYNVSETFLLRANYAASYRTPTLAELTSNGLHETRYEIGNPDLKPQNAFETDVSLHYHADHLTVDLAGFYNVINHYIFISPTADTTNAGDPIYRYMQTNSVLYGGEAGMHLHPQQLEWLHFVTTVALVVGKQESGEYLPFVPACKLEFELRAEQEKVWFFRDAFAGLHAEVVFDQNHPAPNEESTDGYKLFDLNLGGNIKLKSQLLFIGLSINNLLDIKYIDHLSTLKEVGMFNPGRNISLKVKVPFRIKLP